MRKQAIFRELPLGVLFLRMPSFEILFLGMLLLGILSLGMLSLGMLSLQLPVLFINPFGAGSKI